MGHRRPSVLFYAELTRPFVPPDLESHALGGSETALARVAAGLASLDHRVVVVGHPESRHGIFDGVEYVNVESPAWQARNIDVSVVFRQLPHLWRRLPGRRRLFWAHDHLGIFPELPSGLRRTVLGAAWHLGHPLFGRRAAGVVTVSRWLADCFVRYAGWPPRAVYVVPNAVDEATYAPLAHRVRPDPASASPIRVAYTSVPERGLSLLISRIMPAIWHALPNVELHVFSYRPLDRYRTLPAAADARIHFRGAFGHADLGGELAACHLWLYPTDFPETSCIAAMEAQAAGVPVVSSRRYALRETVLDGETGVLIDGRVGSAAYVEEFAGAVVGLLRDGPRRAQMAEAARARILGEFTWDRVAAQWSELLAGLIQER